MQVEKNLPYLPLTDGKTHECSLTVFLTSQQSANMKYKYVWYKHENPYILSFYLVVKSLKLHVFQVIIYIYNFVNCVTSISTQCQIFSFYSFSCLLKKRIRLMHWATFQHWKWFEEVALKIWQFLHALYQFKCWAWDHQKSPSGTNEELSAISIYPPKNLTHLML